MIPILIRLLSKPAIFVSVWWQMKPWSLICMRAWNHFDRGNKKTHTIWNLNLPLHTRQTGLICGKVKKNEVSWQLSNMCVFLLSRSQIPHQVDCSRSHKLWHLHHKVRHVVLWSPALWDYHLWKSTIPRSVMTGLSVTNVSSHIDLNVCEMIIVGVMLQGLTFIFTPI